MVLKFQKLREALQLHKIFRLRQRYIMTRRNTVRLRYVVGYGAFMLVAVTLAFANSGFGPSAGWTSASDQVAQADDQDQSQDVADDEAAQQPVDKTLQDKISSGIRKASAMIEKAPAAAVEQVAAVMDPAKPSAKAVQVGRGDTLVGALESAGVSDDDASGAVKALSQKVNPKSIRAGQVVNVEFKPGEQYPQFSKLTMNVDQQQQVIVSKKNDRFVSDLHKKELKTHVYAGYAQIELSLYGSAERAGIPPQALGDLIRLYSRTIDFQRDIQKGDKIQVLYEGMQDEDGKYVRYNNIVYANLVIGGKAVPMYRFQTEDGRVDYYDPSGRTTRKTLLKTPVDGAHITSGFGMRFHPILGYTRMHKGIDFGAPTGTPIYAAGDATVVFAGRKSGYGNYVKLRHNSELATAYAHMSRFASGMHDGEHVAQGEVIGYVGATGEATGPHLHYEVLVRDNQVNPRSVDLPTGENLGGKELAKFKKTITGLTQQYASLTQNAKVAMAGSGDGSLN